jgi:glycosyltransferase involved in cell wall biosynthesis
MIRHVAVVIPVPEGAEAIDATIESVEQARRRLPASVSSACVIVSDASLDATGAVIERHTGAGPDGGRWTSLIVVRIAHGSLGAARSIGCRVALGGALYRPRNVWLANTDADTVVPGYWLTAQLELAERDVAAVAGTVELDGVVDDTIRAEFEAAHVISLDGTRHPVHGANMGIRGDVYLAAGGWQRQQAGEGLDLWKRLSDVATCVSSHTIAVHTRTAGRAPHESSSPDDGPAEPTVA